MNSAYDQQAENVSSSYQAQLANIQRANQAAAAFQQRKNDAINQTTDFLGGDFIKSGIEGIGGAVAKKTGFDSIAKLGTNIKTMGYKKGLEKTILDMKKDAVSKGKVLAQSEIDKVTEKTKSLWAGTLAKPEDAAKYQAGRRALLQAQNKVQANRNLAQVGEDTLDKDSGDVAKQVKAAARDPASAVTQAQKDLKGTPKRGEGTSYQPAVKDGGEDDDGKPVSTSKKPARLSGQVDDFEQNKRVVTQADIDKVRQGGSILQAGEGQDKGPAPASASADINPVTGQPAKPAVGPVLAEADSSLVDGLEDEDTRVARLSEDNYLKDIQTVQQGGSLGYKPKLPPSLGGEPLGVLPPVKNVVEPSTEPKVDIDEVEKDLPQKQGVSLLNKTPAVADNSTVRDTGKPAVPTPAAPAVPTPAPVAPAPKVQSDPLSEVKVPESLEVPEIDSKLSNRENYDALSRSHDNLKVRQLEGDLDTQQKIEDGLGSGYEKNLSKVPSGPLRNNALKNNAELRLQSMKENAPELLDDTKYPKALPEDYDTAAKAKENAIRSKINNLSDADATSLTNDVRGTDGWTKNKDLKAMRDAGDEDGYRLANNNNQSIANDAVNNFSQGGATVEGGGIGAGPSGTAPTPTVLSTGDDGSANPQSSKKQGDGGPQLPDVPDGGSDDEDEDEDDAKKKLESEAESDVESDVEDDAEKAAVTGAEDVGEDLLGGLTGGLGDLAIGLGTMLIPKLFESEPSENTPIPPPTVSAVATMGQGR